MFEILHRSTTQCRKNIGDILQNFVLLYIMFLTFRDNLVSVIYILDILIAVIFWFGYFSCSNTYYGYLTCSNIFDIFGAGCPAEEPCHGHCRLPALCQKGRPEVLYALFSSYPGSPERIFVETGSASSTTHFFRP